MTSRTKKSAVALGGALLLASGAYGLGSQAGDGAALAGSAGTTTSTRPTGFGPGPGRPGRDLSDAASRLGVTEAKLRAALEDLRPTRADRDDHHATLARALAGELGLPVAKVQAALEKRHAGRRLRRDDRRGDRRDAFASALARELGVAEAKVRAAVEAERPDGRRGGPPELAALARRIGVSEAKLREALEDLRPGPRGGRRGHGPGPGGPAVSALAQDLGVTAARLRAAFENIHDELEREHEARHDRFAAQLADKLGVSQAKVEEVLGSGPHHERRGP